MSVVYERREGKNLIHIEISDKAVALFAGAIGTIVAWITDLVN